MKLSSLRYRRAFTLIELMVVVTIILVTGMIGSNAFSKYVRKVKTTEATMGVENIFRAIVAYHSIIMNMTNEAGDVAFSWENANAKPFPYLFSQRDGGGYTVPRATKEKIFFFNPPNCTQDPTCDWQAWKDVGAGFDTDMLYYRYLVLADSSFSSLARGGEERCTFQVVAEGDLDGDGDTSAFVRSGWLTPTGIIDSTALRFANELE